MCALHRCWLPVPHCPLRHRHALNQRACLLAPPALIRPPGSLVEEHPDAGPHTLLHPPHRGLLLQQVPRLVGQQLPDLGHGRVAVAGGGQGRRAGESRLG